MKEPSKGARKAADWMIDNNWAAHLVDRNRLARRIDQETHLGELVEALEELANAMDEKVNCPRCGRAFPGTQYIPPGRHSKLCPVSKGRKALALVRSEEGECDDTVL